MTNFIDVQDNDGSIFRIVRDLNQAYFGNCIITGNNRQELAILQDPAGSLNYQVDHAILKLDNDPEDRGFDITDPIFFQNILVNVNPGFIDSDMNEYALDSTSQAVDQGSGTITTTPPPITIDILGKSRFVNGQPDLGAFERQF